MPTPVKSGEEFLVNSTTLNDQFAPTITALSDGRFVVAWYDASQTGGDTSGSAIRAQAFDFNGRPVAKEFLVNTTERETKSTPRSQPWPMASNKTLEKQITLVKPDLGGANNWVMSK